MTEVAVTGADGLDKGLATAFALIALGAGRRPAKLADVATVDLAIVATAWIPAEAAGGHQHAVVPSILLRHGSRSPAYHQHARGRLPVVEMGVMGIKTGLQTHSLRIRHLHCRPSYSYARQIAPRGI